MPSPIRTLLCTLALALTSGTLAHAYLESSSPPGLSTVTTPLEKLELTFSEPIEVNFSVFKLYPLPLEPHWGVRELALAARELMRERLDARNHTGDVEITVQTDGRTTRHVTLFLTEALPAGSYVVMWRVLSIDTHTTQDFLVFHYAPEE